MVINVTFRGMQDHPAKADIPRLPPIAVRVLCWSCASLGDHSLDACCESVVWGSFFLWRTSNINIPLVFVSVFNDLLIRVAVCGSIFCYFCSYQSPGLWHCAASGNFSQLGSARRLMALSCQLDEGQGDMRGQAITTAQTCTRLQSPEKTCQNPRSKASGGLKSDTFAKSSGEKICKYRFISNAIPITIYPSFSTLT